MGDKALYIDFTELHAELSLDSIEDLKFLYSLCLEDNPKIAVHRCADGLVSGALLQYYYQKQGINPVIVPITFKEMHISKFSKILEDTEWYASADLLPFPRNSLDIYADHHISNAKLAKTAKKVLFDSTAHSAARVLLTALEITDPYLVHLVELVDIIDTDTFKIEPPLSVSSPSNDQEEAWLLNDATAALNRPRDFIQLYEKIVQRKQVADILTLFEFAIKQYRIQRRRSIEIVKNIIQDDVTVVIFCDPNYNAMAVIHELLQENTKVAVALIKHGNNKFHFKARHNNKLSDEEKKELRLDVLAEELGGGGHISAAAAQVTNVKETINKVANWARKFSLSTIVIDLDKTQEFLIHRQL